MKGNTFQKQDEFLWIVTQIFLRITTVTYGSELVNVFKQKTITLLAVMRPELSMTAQEI